MDSAVTDYAVTIYWILFLLGLGFAVISAILSGFSDLGGHDLGAGGHDINMGGHDIGGGYDIQPGGVHDLGGAYHGQGEIGLNPVSPMTILAFVGGFGGGGLIGNSLGLPNWGSVLIALPVGFVLAFSLYYLMLVLNRSNVSSEARASEIVGVTAEIITPIVEDRTGEIAYISRGARYNAPARSIDGKTISKGRPVKVWRMVGSTCYVKEIPPEEAETPHTDTLDHPEND
jgi:membrane protein implicated in regulation of membrane protease activity